MGYIMGIDGGGSTIRVAIVRRDLSQVGYTEVGTVNPSVIGRDAAATLIQEQIHRALQNANLSADQISATGIGVAGASAEHSADWLREVVTPVLPATKIVPSSDIEIALVGAHGKREGILILAGTGSVALGINTTGESVQVGGWGYLMGDEGSGYWIGMEALKAITRASDGRNQPTAMTEQILNHLELKSPKQIIMWLYSKPSPPEVAKLAPIILNNSDDPAAHNIILRGAYELAKHVHTIKMRLNNYGLPVAFAGALLTSHNPLSKALCFRLGLADIPPSKYSPVIGAAILAGGKINAH